ncbi:type IV pilin protein [Aquirhabdus parva]|uniref:Prepilin-type N-terminal cleavage/methylation domain-containing protein n=1 Tax=Aquirhabdus parva TaxID=2283318 RepID=A0A345PAW9_9GAMM|nr:type IV pilin protein [Aquirhabdus parva]AXI04428.1 prepilin-type N-terminal cleavage/methylation domain-containing protein [Aquirhabdus parva]
MDTAMRSKGFTLIELMIALVIVVVLTIMALPSYNRYIRSSARADAQSQMVKIAGDLERWRAKNLSYANFTPEIAFASTPGSIVDSTTTNATIYLPKGSTSANYKYQLALLDGSTRTSSLTSSGLTAGQRWILVAQPNTANSTLSLASRLVLSSQGVRCMTDSALTDATMKSNIKDTTNTSDSALCAGTSKPW